MWCMLFFPSSEWWKIIPGLECCSFISSAVVPFHRHHCNSRSHVIFCLSPSIIYPGTESCWSPNEWLFTCDTCPLLLLSNFTAWISRLLHLPLRRLRPTWRGWGPGARCRTPRSPEKQLSVLMLSTRNVLKKTDFKKLKNKVLPLTGLFRCCRPTRVTFSRRKDQSWCCQPDHGWNSYAPGPNPTPIKAFYVAISYDKMLGYKL